MALLLKNISRITRQRLRTKLYAEYHKQKREAIPEKKHSAKEVKAAAAISSDSGIDSPLTETDNTRTYHATEKYIKSSDGLFVIAYQHIATMTFRDASNREVVFNFDEQ